MGFSGKMVLATPSATPNQERYELKKQIKIWVNIKFNIHCIPTWWFPCPLKFENMNSANSRQLYMFSFVLPKP